MNHANTSERTRRIAFIGMFAAIASVLMFIEIPLPFAPPFYKLDFSEVPVLIGTFSLGPVAGILIELIKIFVHLLFKGTQTAGVGELANFFVGCAFCVPAGLIYRRRKTKRDAIISMAVGTVFLIIAGCLMNAYVLLPAYASAFHMDLSALIAMGTAVNTSVDSLLTFVVLCVAPFNLLKGILVSVITFVLYKRISRFVKGV